MFKKIVSLDETVDGALRKASKILMLISLPALLVSGYRNLIVDFLPLHQLILTLIWLGFLVASLKNINLVKVRFNLVILLFLVLFLLTGYRNQSFIFVDAFLIIAAGLMAFRQSLFVILCVLISFVVGLLLIINETFVPLTNNSDSTYGLLLLIHCCALLLSFVLFHTIRHVVENYQNLYESQVAVNADLTEENKKSFLKIVQGKETVEEERHRLKLSAFSLSSQMSKLEKVMNMAKKTDDPNLLGYASTRIEELHKDLSDYSSDGNYISSETKTFSISELAFLIEQYLRPFQVVLSNSTNIFVENNKIFETKFQFPINFIKIICHHLLEICSEELVPASIKFEFQNIGKRVRNKQQIKMSCLVKSDNDLSQFDFLKFNKSIESNKILNNDISHVGVIKAILNRVSGKLRANLANDELEFELLLWVDVYSDKASPANPPKLKDIFGFS